MPDAPPAPPTPDPTPEPALSRGQRRAFWALTLALPVLFFLLLEGGLRLFGYGEDYPLFEPIEGSEQYLIQSRDVARRYFHELEDAPTALHDVFHAEKRPGELRLFVQGGSSAAGFPFYHGGAFSRMLEARLADALPDRPVEVVNTAMAAVNSYALLDLADEIIEQEPDAVLVYAGHNEYYGALGVGSTESLGGMRGLVNLYLRLRPLRTVQLLRSALGGVAGAVAGGAAGEPARGSLMARMVRQQTIPYGSAEFFQGVEQFAGNLADLLAKYERAGVPVFVGTLVANERDHRPFETVFDSDTDEAAWRAAYEGSVAALRRGDAAGAAELLEEVTRMDTLAADGFFALGRAHEAAGDTAAARRAFAAASDRDALRFRAPTVLNDVVRRVAAEHGATVVDVEARFREAAPGGTIGAGEMLEHLHPTVDGYFLLADAFYDALLRSPLLDGAAPRSVPDAVARRRVRLTPADSLVGVIRVRNLMQAWPFEPVGSRVVSVADTMEADTPEERAAVALYRNEKGWLEATEDLATELEREGRVAEAVRTREAMLQSYPMLAEPYLGLAGLYTRRGEYDRAIANYEAAIERDEASGNALGLLGAIYLNRGMQQAASDRAAAQAAFEEARGLLERARARNGRNPQTLYNLSGAYAQLGQFDEARETAEALLRVQPDHRAGRALLSSLPPSR